MALPRRWSIVSKYLITGGYTPEAWANMIENPTSREQAARKLGEAGGAKLEAFYWSFGDDDFVAIYDCPDDVTAGALSVVAGSSGAFRHVRTTKLVTTDEARKLLEKAKAAKGAYTPPTARQPAGVR